MTEFPEALAESPASIVQIAEGTVPIAVVGIGARFPGADNADEFWSLLAEGRSGATRFERQALLDSGETSNTLDDPSYVPVRGILHDVSGFDARFFGFTPTEAAVADPQHRLFLECAWEALEGACHGGGKGRVGVFAGSSRSGYPEALRQSAPSLAAALGEMQIALGSEREFLASGVAYRLGLTGPAVTVQTGCSTGLVAVALACRSLQTGDTDVAVAGAASIVLPQERGYRYEHDMIYAPDGICRAFDAEAAGCFAGNGVGAVALCRLADAVAGGLPVHAVIRGIAMNNDGARSPGFTAPGVEGQAEVISMALACSGVPSESVGMIEAHGTGTPVGDPVEFAALCRAYGRDLKPGSCALGSVKTNIGHLNDAAGIAGLIKLCMALREGRVPPSLNYHRPNPALAIENSPFFVPDRLIDWPKTDRPRRAAVSSFGIGGTNVHAVLEEAPVTSPDAAEPWQLYPVSAKTPAALEVGRTRLAADFASRPAEQGAGVAHTLQSGRRPFAERAVVVARELSEAAAILAARDHPRLLRNRAPESPPRLLFLFPGGGSQYRGMGRRLYARYPAFREAMDQCCAAAEAAGLDLRAVLYGRDGDLQTLTRPREALPAQLATELAMAALLGSWGLRPAALLGHSLGEYAAATVAGVMIPAEAIAVAIRRGELFETLPVGAMIDVHASAGSLAQLLPPDLSVAAINAEHRCTLSGPAVTIEHFAGVLAERGIECSRVPIDVAAHSAELDSIIDDFAAFMARFPLRPPHTPVLSNLTGDWAATEELTEPAYWARHLRHTVRFADALAAARSAGQWLFVEVGPGHTLGQLARMGAPNAEPVISTLPHAREPVEDEAIVLGALGRAWLHGVQPNWTALHGSDRRFLSLPSYPFQRQRHWIDPEPVEQIRVPTESGGVDGWLWTTAWQPAILPAPTLDTAARSVAIIGPASPQTAATAATLTSLGVRVEQMAGADENWASAPSAETWQVPEALLCLWPMIRQPDFGRMARILRLLAASGRRCRLVLATHGLFNVNGLDRVDPEAALLLGPALVAPQEHPDLVTSVVDLGQGTMAPPAEVVAACLSRLLLAPAPPPRLAMRGNRLLRPSFSRLEPDSVADPPLRDGEVYLITGGLGPVGLQMAEAISSRVQACIVLTTRNTDRARRLSGPPGEAVDKDIAARLQALRARGTEIAVRAADVTDPTAMAALFGWIDDTHGRLDGVVHAAAETSGDAALRLLADLDDAQLTAQLHPKVAGLRVLDQLLGHRPLAFRMAVSSNAAVLGGIGLAAYASANAVLDAMAEASLERGAAGWQSVGFDGWPRGPTADQRPHTSIERFTMSPAQATAAFLRVLALGPGHISVSTGDLHARARQSVEHATPMPSAPSPTPDNQGTDDPVGDGHVAPRTDIERTVAAAWRVMLGRERIGIYDNFFDLGGQSLLATRMMKRLRAELAAEVPLRRLFEGPTVAELAAAFAEASGQIITPAASSIGRREAP